MRLFRSLVAALAVAGAGTASRAQVAAHQHANTTPKTGVRDSTHTLMATSPHMRMTAARTATTGDSARARAIVDTLRKAVAKYADTSVALAEGYRMFKPQLRFRPVYHFTSRTNAKANESSFDPTRPTSLLYERAPNGRLELVGAMYTAPRRATEDELNARVPSGIAPWHLHVNICEAPSDAPERRRETRNGRMLFGPAGVVATKADCDAVGGRFLPEDFNWMMHVDTRHGNDLAAAFSDHK
jgi:hypothetical protein